MVALPKKWVKEMGLRQGSEIIITRPSLSSLLITADAVFPHSDKHEAIIEVQDRDGADSLFREIVSLYILGYNQISLRGSNGHLSSSKRDAIKDLVRRHLIGTEGVADSKDKIDDPRAPRLLRAERRQRTEEDAAHHDIEPEGSGTRPAEQR